MKTASKKLVVSIVILLLAVCLTTATTFAWFALNNTPSVESFNLEITTGEGLQVSAANDANFSYSLSKAAINTALGTGNTIDDISLLANTVGGTWATSTWTNTLDAATFGLKTLKQNSGADTVANSFQDAPANSYLKFDIWFKAVGNSSFDVQLNTTATAFTQVSAGSAITATRAYSEADQYVGATPIAIDGTMPAADVTNAIRVAFVPTTGNAIIWNVNGNKAGSYDTWAVNPAQANYDDHTEPNLTDSQKTIGTDGVLVGDALANTTLLTGVDSTTAQKITVWIWAEGKDKDCFDAILTASFSTLLNFVGIVA